MLRELAKERAEKRVERERVVRLMIADPRYQRLEEYKDEALRSERRAEDMYRVSRWPQDKERADRAKRSADRALKALYRFERAFFARHGMRA
jgi:hypothetical protein